MKRRAPLFAAVLCAAGLFATDFAPGDFGRLAGAPARKKAPPLSFQSFLERTLRYDPAFQLILIEEFYLEYRKDLLLPPRDLILEITAQYGFFASEETGDRNEGWIGGVALNKLFPTTGTEVSLNYDRTGPGQRAGGESRSTLGLELSQAIARNAFGRATRMQSERIDVQNALARYQIIEAYEDYLASLLVIYLDWHTAEENRKAAQAAVNEALAVYRLTRRKEGFGVAYQDESRKSYIEVLTARQQLIADRTTESRARRRIAALIGTKQEELPETVAPEILAINREGQGANESPRTIKMLDLLRREGILDRKIAEDNLLPSAKLFAGYQFLSDEWDLRRPDQRGYVGFNMRLNFGRQVEKAAARTARLDEKKKQVENRRRYLNLELELDVVRDRLTGTREQLKLAQQRMIVARQVLYAEQNNYRLGQSDFIELSRARTDLEAARLNLVRQKADLALFQVESMRLEDRLVRRLPDSESK